MRSPALSLRSDMPAGARQAAPDRAGPASYEPTAPAGRLARQPRPAPRRRRSIQATANRRRWPQDSDPAAVTGVAGPPVRSDRTRPQFMDHLTSGSDSADVVHQQDGQLGTPKRLPGGSAQRSRQIDRDLMAPHGRQQHRLQLLGLQLPAWRRFTAGHGQQINAFHRWHRPVSSPRCPRAERAVASASRLSVRHLTAGRAHLSGCRRQSASSAARRERRRTRAPRPASKRRPRRTAHDADEAAGSATCSADVGEGFGQPTGTCWQGYQSCPEPYRPLLCLGSGGLLPATRYTSARRGKPMAATRAACSTPSRSIDAEPHWDRR